MTKFRNLYHLPFHKKLFISVSSLFILFVFTIFLFQYNREKDFRLQTMFNMLQDYNTLVNAKIQTDGVNNINLKNITHHLMKKDLRVTVIDFKGKVLLDTKFSHLSDLDNHFNRPEITQAMAKGHGQALRYSETVGKDYFYTSTRFNNYIIRSSLPFNNDSVSFMNIDRGFIYFLVIISIIVIFTLLYFSNVIGKSISKLQEFTNQAEMNEAKDIRIKLPNDDISQITGNIIKIYNRLQKTTEELSIANDKLIKHLQFSKEGLAIYTQDKKEIFANNLFVQYINVISDKKLTSVDDVFELEEFKKFNHFISESLKNKKERQNLLTESMLLSKNGKSFQMECIVFPDNTLEISINNITQQEEETRLKRQLTQNVAHELKTPVSSIQGYMETILTNPDMPEEKRQQFMERCFVQTIRLADLLRDISMLNRIDEAQNLFDLEDVNLNMLVRDIVADSGALLKEKDMKIDVTIPDHTSVKGNTSLLYSIFRNLLDNALAYAGEHTQINIRCYRQDDIYLYFSFCDTGVGVPEEHLNRIFERFYRVDKGRTRKLGGTGLGLAIVKNAVHFHKGEISAKNRADGGLEFLFSLKRS